jgi:tRNA A37 threonylcarbamoyladenosine synthetase subunit TsaC/SUA5/YrdC
VYLDGGRTPGAVSSSIVDLSGETPVLVRDGVLPVAELRALVPDLIVP